MYGLWGGGGCRGFVSGPRLMYCEFERAGGCVFGLSIYYCKRFLRDGRVCFGPIVSVVRDFYGADGCSGDWLVS